MEKYDILYLFQTEHAHVKGEVYTRECCIDVERNINATFLFILNQYSF